MAIFVWVQDCKSLWMPTEGVEPSTQRLKVACSTTELRQHKGNIPRVVKALNTGLTGLARAGFAVLGTKVLERSLICTKIDLVCLYVT